jgi:hypothetical protein
MYVCNSLCLVVYPRQAAYPQHVPHPPCTPSHPPPPSLNTCVCLRCWWQAGTAGTTLTCYFVFLGEFVTREHVRHNKSGIAHRGRTRINHSRELPLLLLCFVTVYFMFILTASSTCLTPPPHVLCPRCWLQAGTAGTTSL